MSLAQELHDMALEKLQGPLNLVEQTAADGGPYMRLTSHVPMAQGEIGNVRVFTSDKVARVVCCSIVVPAIKLDSHMLFVFTDSEGAVPHFTVDSVQAPGTYAFHLDLLPRVELAVNLAHMDEVFAGLTETSKAHSETEGLSKAALDPRQFAVMSPWMLASRATEDAFKETFKAVETYLNHWLGILEGGVSEVGNSTPQSRAERDAAHRAILFSPEVDPVWQQITPLIGEGDANKLIALLRDTSAGEAS